MNKNIRIYGVALALLFPITASSFDQSSPADSLVVDTAGNVGVGTANPTSLFHVRKSGANLTVEDVNATAGIRTVVGLKNKGGVGFKLTDTSISNSWEFRSGGGGTFTVVNTGVPGGNLLLTTAGGILMGLNVAGGSASSNFNLKPNGNLNIPNGSVTATNFITSSSRTVKKDIKKVDNNQVMSKLTLLDIPEWRYKDEGVKGRHIGPIAEDFYTLFELGPDNKHVTATDIASIALIAAKELQKKAQASKDEADSLRKQLQETTISLKADNTRLQKRLASLEKLVTNLASASTLKGKGKNIALK